MKILDSILYSIFFTLLLYLIAIMFVCLILDPPPGHTTFPIKVSAVIFWIAILWIISGGIFCYLVRSILIVGAIGIGDAFDITFYTFLATYAGPFGYFVLKRAEKSMEPPRPRQYW